MFKLDGRHTFSRLIRQLPILESAGRAPRVHPLTAAYFPVADSPGIPLTNPRAVGRHAATCTALVAVVCAIGLGLAVLPSSGAGIRPYSPPTSGQNAANTVRDVFVQPLGGLNIEPSPSDSPAALLPVLPEADVFAIPAIPAPISAPVVPAPALIRTSAPSAPPELAPLAADQVAPLVARKSDFYVPTASSAGPTQLEQRLFDATNIERAKASLAPYTYDAGLTKVARTRSQQMVDQSYFAHTDPFGYSMYVELLAYFGYESYAWAGENLALNNYPVAEAAERAMTSLMSSPTHRANILATDFLRVGIGEVTTADGRHVFSMIFLG